MKNQLKPVGLLEWNHYVTKKLQNIVANDMARARKLNDRIEEMKVPDPMDFDLIQDIKSIQKIDIIQQYELVLACIEFLNNYLIQMEKTYVPSQQDKVFTHTLRILLGDYLQHTILVTNTHLASEVLMD